VKGWWEVSAKGQQEEEIYVWEGIRGKKGKNTSLAVLVGICGGREEPNGDLRTQAGTRARGRMWERRCQQKKEVEELGKNSIDEPVKERKKEENE
jgi:hypothetical protein